MTWSTRTVRTLSAVRIAGMDGDGVSRRELLAAGAAAGVALGLPGAAAASRPAEWSSRLDFASLGAGEGWPGWVCPGVANLRRRDGLGVLEAGSDVIPYDPRPVAFAVDQRFRDAEISAVVDAAGAGTGVVLRRTGPRDYYAAIYDSEQSALVLVRRSPSGEHELARAAAGPAVGPLRLQLGARGSRPTVLTARLEPQAGAP